MAYLKSFSCFTKLLNDFRFTRFIVIQETILRQVRILQLNSNILRKQLWVQMYKFLWRSLKLTSATPECRVPKSTCSHHKVGKPKEKQISLKISLNLPLWQPYLLNALPILFFFSWLDTSRTHKPKRVGQKSRGDTGWIWHRWQCGGCSTMSSLPFLCNNWWLYSWKMSLGPGLGGRSSKFLFSFLLSHFVCWARLCLVLGFLLKKEELDLMASTSGKVWNSLIVRGKKKSVCYQEFKIFVPARIATFFALLVTFLATNA